MTRSLPPGTSLTIVTADEPGYESARAAGNLAADQRPVAVALPRTAAEVAEAVRLAAASRLRIAVQGTGHDAAPLGSLDSTLLIRTGEMREVCIVPAARLAKVAAGAVWPDVVGPAAERGLIPLAGWLPDIGVVGHALGGGLSWLARRYGLAVESVLAAEVVTADGRRRRVDATHDAELFWALRGGGCDFVAVTALEIRLYPADRATAGALLFPLDRAAAVLDAWRRWIPGLPDELTSCARLLRFPRLPEFPAALRGGSFAVVEVAHLAPVAATAALVAPLRAVGPIMDTVGPATPADLLALRMDPPAPVPRLADGMVLGSLPVAAVEALLDAAGTASGSPLLSVELRQLGGALTRRSPGAGALGGLAGEVALFAAGMVPDSAATVEVRAGIQRVLAALRPWRAKRDYLELRRGPDGPARFFPPETLDRLRAVRNAYDPTGLFRSNHPITVS
jgi:FAD/FMN-containing dehydrogenase